MAQIPALHHAIAIAEEFQLLELVASFASVASSAANSPTTIWSVAVPSSFIVAAGPV